MTRFLLCLNLLALLAGGASAFTTTPHPAAATLTLPPSIKPLYMFSADDKPVTTNSGLSEVKPGETMDALESVPTISKDDTTAPTGARAKPTMQVRNRNSGEIMEVEVNESFLANEKLEMNWWAWVGFVAFPFLILVRGDVC